MWTARPEQHLGESGLSRRFRRPALSTGLLSRRGIKRIRDEAGLYQNRQAGPRQERRLQHQGRRRSWHRGEEAPSVRLRQEGQLSAPEVAGGRGQALKLVYRGDKVFEYEPLKAAKSTRVVGQNGWRHPLGWRGQDPSGKEGLPLHRPPDHPLQAETDHREESQVGQPIPFP